MTVTRLRELFVLPRPTGWHLFLTLLLIALGSEYWDKDPIAAGGALLPWPRFLLAVAVLPLVVPPGDWRWSSVLRLPTALGPLLIFWLTCGFSVLAVAMAPGPSDYSQFARTYVHLTVYVVFACVLVKWMTWPRLLLLVRGYYALGIVAAVLSVVQFLHGTLGVLPWLAPLRFQSAEYEVGLGLTTGFRAAAFFGEPSWAARYYVHFLAIALSFWWSTGRRIHLGAALLFLAAFYMANSLLGYAILLTFALLVGAAQVRARAVLSLSRRTKFAAAAAAYVLLLLWLVDMVPRAPDLLERSIARIGLVLQGGGGAGNRIDSVFAGLEVWELAPALGVGLGNIDRYITRFYLDPAWVLRSQFASDSLYVQLLAETGPAGLVAFLWFWVNLVWFRRRRDATEPTPTVAYGYALVMFLQVDLVAQAVGMANSSDYLNPHLWTVVAIMLSAKTLLAGRVTAVEPAPFRDVARFQPRLA